MSSGSSTVMDRDSQSTIMEYVNSRAAMNTDNQTVMNSDTDKNYQVHISFHCIAFFYYYKKKRVMKIYLDLVVHHLQRQMIVLDIHHLLRQDKFCLDSILRFLSFYERKKNSKR